MDPFISYIATVAPVLAPLIAKAGEPVAKYFGEQTVELLKRLFNSGEDPIEKARVHQQSLAGFIETKTDWSSVELYDAYKDSMRAMQEFVRRPDVFPNESLLRDFYFELGLAEPFGQHGSYEDEKKQNKKDTASYFVELAWADQKLDVAAKWLQQKRSASFRTMKD